MTEKKIKKPRGKARILDGKCVACGERCASSCPVDCITMSDTGEPLAIDQEKCIGCDKCIKVCAVDALEMFYTPEQVEQLKLWEAQKSADTEELDPEEQALQERLAEYKGVWVFIEQYTGEVAKVSWELLGVGRELADTRGVELTAVIIGHDIDRFTLEFCLVSEQHNKVAARGTGVIVAYDRKHQQKMPIPSLIKDKILELQKGY